MTGGEALGAVEKSAVEKIEGLEWAIGCKIFPGIRIGGKGKRRAERTVPVRDAMGYQGR